MAGLLIAWIVLAAAPAAPEFLKVLGGPATDRGVHVEPTRDGGYVLTGVTLGGHPGGEDLLLMKLDAAGEPEWSVNHGGPESDNGWVVAETGTGYVVAGYSNGFGEGGFDFYFIATDAQGELVWTRTFGGEQDDQCWAMLPTGDGGYLLAGETRSSGAGEEDFFVVRTDGNGHELWSRTYGGEAGDRCFGVAPADDGGFLLVGQTYSRGAGARAAYIVRIDEDGNELTSRVFGGEHRDLGHSVCRLEDGGYLVTGYTASFAESHTDPWLIRLNADADSLWTRTIPVDGVCRAISGDVAPDGGFYVTGFRHDPAARRGAAVLFRTDANGNPEWKREYLETAGQSFGYTVRATPDGGCVFTGHTTEGSAGELDVLLVKTAPAGE